MRSFRKGRRSLLLDAAIGAASGLLASWVMELAQKPILRAGGPETRERERLAQGDLPPATVRVAERAAALAGRSLPADRRDAAGEVVHYGTGAAFGALFGVLAPRLPLPVVAAGALYGAAVWVVSDETLVPALGLSRRPWDYPASTHAKALASHLVYGTAMDAGFRLIGATIH
jgi:hypothetical protein